MKKLCIIRSMEGDEIRLRGVFENGVIRPIENLELAPGTQVMLSITVINADASSRAKGIDKVTEPTLFTASETNYLVIPEDADLREVTVNYWPKEGVSATDVRRRSVVKVPTRQQPVDDSDLLVMDDIDSLQN